MTLSNGDVISYQQAQRMTQVALNRALYKLQCLVSAYDLTNPWDKPEKDRIDTLIGIAMDKVNLYNTKLQEFNKLTGD